jgi:hypothetical protein
VKRSSVVLGAIALVPAITSGAVAAKKYMNRVKSVGAEPVRMKRRPRSSRGAAASSAQVRALLPRWAGPAEDVASSVKRPVDITCARFHHEPID